MLEYMQERWETMTMLPKYKTVKAAIEAGLDNLCKWYKRIHDTDIYFVSLVLDGGT